MWNNTVLTQIGQLTNNGQIMQIGHKALAKLQVNLELVSPSHLSIPPIYQPHEIYFPFFRSFVWVRHRYR